ncbi:MAG: ion channel [Desulfobacterales bacterium]|nr:ion channel [Desulfobacterales bacterium]
MGKKISGPFSEFFFNHRIIFLLVAILFLIIGSPFLDELFRYGIIPDILMTIIFILGIHAISRTKKAVYIALFLAFPMFLSVWSAYLLEDIELLVVGESFGAIFCGFLIALLVQFIFMQEKITKEVIYAAVVVYLLMAIMWSFLYFIMDYIHPNSFSFPEGHTKGIYPYLYFSFVTITTLGFGDVSPLTHKASSLVILEAVTGQIYLVVIVAWLVGMHVSRRSK